MDETWFHMHLNKPSPEKARGLGGAMVLGNLQVPGRPTYLE